MDELWRALGVTDERIASARATLGVQMRGEGEAFIDEAVDRTLALPGYEHLDAARVRPNTARAMVAVLETLEGGEMSLFGELLRDIAYNRARQGLPPASLYDLADITEAMLDALALRSLDQTEDLLAAKLVTRRIADGARAVIVEGFQRAHLELRAEAELLADLFSAPLLPALPGVLLMPIVGPMSPQRAAAILETLLGGIERHRASVVILDVTGLAGADASLADDLRQTSESARLLGARVVLVGVKPKLALTLARDAALALLEVDIHATLAAALLSAARLS